MRDKVISLLEALGVTVPDTDPLIDFIINSVTERIKNETNQTAIPEGLEFMAVEMVVGQYLKWKKDCGQLEGFDLDAAVKSIQEGDTNITFAVGEGSATPEQRLNNLIEYLINGRTREFIRYRRLVW